MKAYPTTADRCVSLIAEHKGLFTVQLRSLMPGVSEKSIEKSVAAMAHENGKLKRRMKRVPAELRSSLRARPLQWFYEIREQKTTKGKPITKKDGMPSLAGKVPPRTPTEWQPMRGSGLYGQPIVMRPGSDYALRAEPYISMEARR